MQSFCTSISSVKNVLLYFEQGNTPLLMATKKRMIDVVKLLLRGRADSSSKGQVKNQIWC